MIDGSPLPLQQWVKHVFTSHTSTEVYCVPETIREFSQIMYIRAYVESHPVGHGKQCISE